MPLPYRPPAKPISCCRDNAGVDWRNVPGADQVMSYVTLFRNTPPLTKHEQIPAPSFWRGGVWAFIRAALPVPDASGGVDPALVHQLVHPDGLVGA